MLAVSGKQNEMSITGKYSMFLKKVASPCFNGVDQVNFFKCPFKTGSYLLFNFKMANPETVQ